MHTLRTTPGRFRLWLLIALVTAMGWMGGILVVHNLNNWQQFCSAAWATLFQSVLVGGLSAAGLWLSIRYHTRHPAARAGGPPWPLVLGELGIALALLALTIYTLQHDSDWADAIAPILLLVARCVVTALVEWLILRPALPGMGMRWGALWGLGILIGTTIGETIRWVTLGIHAPPWGSRQYVTNAILGNAIPALAVGIIAGIVLSSLMNSAAKASDPPPAEEWRPGPIPWRTRMDGHVFGPAVGTLAWLLPGALVLFGGAQWLTLQGSDWITFSELADTLDFPLSTAATFAGGWIACTFLGLLFGPALLNEAYLWAERRAAQHLAPFRVTLWTLAAAVLLAVILGFAAIRYNAIKPRFAIDVGPLLRVSAPCPVHMQLDCEWFENWPYYEVMVNSGSFVSSSPPHFGVPTTLNDYPIVRIRLARGVDPGNEDWP